MGLLYSLKGLMRGGSAASGSPLWQSRRRVRLQYLSRVRETHLQVRARDTASLASPLGGRNWRRCPDPRWERARRALSSPSRRNAAPALPSVTAARRSATPSTRPPQLKPSSQHVDPTRIGSHTIRIPHDSDPKRFGSDTVRITSRHVDPTRFGSHMARIPSCRTCADARPVV